MFVYHPDFGGISELKCGYEQVSRSLQVKGEEAEERLQGIYQVKRKGVLLK
jgi:hypothetical protein